MKLTYDTDSILYGVLKGSAPLVAAISGGIYSGDRPDSSEKEDITVNTTVLTQDYKPQRGTSNVNIHVPDLSLNIGGMPQRKADTARLKTVANLVLDALRAAKVDGLGFVVENQTTVREEATNQHYVNIRISWSIH